MKPPNLPLRGARQAGASDSGLRFQPPAHDVAEPEHVLICVPVIGEESFLAPPYVSSGKEELEMLGQVRLPETGGLDELRNRPLPIAQLVQNLEPRWLGERLEPFGDDGKHIGREWLPGHRVPQSVCV